MTRYQFDGDFYSTAWTSLPTEDEVKEELARAISESAQGSVFGMEVGRVDVQGYDDDFPRFRPSSGPVAHVVVSWSVEDRE